MSKAKDFFFALKKEKDGSVYMSRLIYANLIQKRVLTDSQKLLVKKQSINLLKTFFLIIIFLFPFGSFILIGVNFFPFRKFIFPSTFLKYFFNKKT
jgi:hypothetical protein